MSVLRPKMLVLNRYYLPGYRAGGPVTTLNNFITALGEEFDFNVITSDRDIGDLQAYSNVLVGCWTSFEGTKIYYIPKNEMSFFKIVKVLRETQHDILYLNGYFSLETTLYPLLAVKLRFFKPAAIVLAPRGTFSNGALGLKTLKKRSYVFFAKLLGLHKGLIWQASTNCEKIDIERVIGSTVDVRIASDLVSPHVVDCEPKVSLDGTYKVIFLSRISPMKNLKFALNTLKQCEAKIQFSIYGPIEDETYWLQCENIISKLPDNVEAQYKGSIHPREVQSTLSKYHLMFLPTLGENFGHVISESLCAGTPVLISDLTPWQEFPSKVGKVLPLKDMSLFAHYIDESSRLQEGEVKEARSEVKKFATKLVEESDDLVNNIDLFKSAL